MQRISVHLKNDCDGNQLDYNNDLTCNWKQELCTTPKLFEEDYLTVMGNAKL